MAEEEDVVPELVHSGTSAGSGVVAVRGLNRDSVMSASVMSLQEGSVNLAKDLASGELSHGPVGKLRSFRSLLFVRLSHHTAENPMGTNMLVQLIDTIRYSQFTDWLSVTIYGLPGKAAHLIVRSVGLNEDLMELSDGGALAKWMDEMWIHQPLELHVFDSQPVLLAYSKAAAQETSASKLFDMLDKDQSGDIDNHEALAAHRLCLVRGHASTQEVSAFLQAAFASADKDRDRLITRKEFLRVFDHLDDSFLRRLFRSPSFRRRQLEAEALCSYCWRQTLEAASAPKPYLNKVMFGAPIKLDANPDADYGIELSIPNECVDEANRLKWVECSTVLDELVEEFESPHELNKLCSPLVLTDFEPGTTLHGKYSVTLPHCFSDPIPARGLYSGTSVPLEKGDLFVAFSTLGEASWVEVMPEDFELLPADVTINRIPSVKVQLEEGGVVGVFSRASASFSQRVMCVTFVPETIVPLEPDVMRLYVLPDLPNELAEAFYKEVTQRGLAVAAGCSSPIDVVIPKASMTMMNINVWNPGEKDSVTAYKAQWSGEQVCKEYPFHPEDWHDLELGRSGLAPAVAGGGGGDGDADADAASSAPPPALGETKGTSGAATFHGAHVDAVYRVSIGASCLEGRRYEPKNPDVETKFSVGISVNEFPSPHPPKNLRVLSRTQTNVAIAWDAPDYWGGCALKSYEIQIRLKSKDGKLGEWVTVADAKGWETESQAAMNVYACELRGRSYNCGTYRPSEWSEIVCLEDEKTEEKLAKEREGKEAKESGNIANHIARLREARKKKKAKAKANKVEGQGGMAVIDGSGDASSGPWKPEQFTSAADMGGWSEFTQSIGQYYLEAGVPDGVYGTLFDLFPEQVEALVVNEIATGMRPDHLKKNAPLIDLAICGVWVLETLAHHTTMSGPWCQLLNGISGLLDYAALVNISRLDMDGHQVGEEHMRRILDTLVKVYHTLQSCEEGRYVANQLGHRYSKSLQKRLKKEFHGYLAELLQDVTDEVIHLASVSQALRTSKQSPIEHAQLSQMLKVVPGFENLDNAKGSMSYKINSYKERLEQAALPRLSFVQKRASSMPEGVKAARLTLTLLLDGQPQEGFSASSLTAPMHPDKAHVTWTNEHVEINLKDLPGELPKPCEMKATVYVLRGEGASATEEEFGTVTFSMSSPRGFASKRIVGADGVELECGAYVSLYYEVGQWLTNAVDGGE